MLKRPLVMSKLALAARLSAAPSALCTGCRRIFRPRACGSTITWATLSTLMK